MFARFTPRQRTILQALFVTFLWSTSWVIIKLGLDDMPPLVFAGMRYVLAFVCLLPLLLRADRLAAVRGLSSRQWGQLAVLGVIFYAITQGTQFAALVYLPAVTLSMMLNLTAIIVALLGVAFLAEYITRRQMIGIGVFLFGVLVYFYPVVLPWEQVLGLIIGMVSVIATSVAAVMGRGINRRGDIPPSIVTIISMGIGSILLLAVGVLLEGIPVMSPVNWLMVIWLALVNTAFAFTLWNHTLRTLTAVESNIINNTMLVQIAILAWVFLGEAITLQEMGGLTLVVAGVLMVQLRRAGKIQRPAPDESGEALKESA